LTPSLKRLSEAYPTWDRSATGQRRKAPSQRRWFGRVGVDFSAGLSYASNALRLHMRGRR